MTDKSSMAVRWVGLSEDEAQARLKREGFNELPRGRRRTPFRIVLEVMREPMLMLLLGGGVVYLALGDFKESILLLAFGEAIPPATSATIPTAISKSVISIHASRTSSIRSSILGGLAQHWIPMTIPLGDFRL